MKPLKTDPKSFTVVLTCPFWNASAVCVFSKRSRTDTGKSCSSLETDKVCRQGFHFPGFFLPDCTKWLLTLIEKACLLYLKTRFAF